MFIKSAGLRNTLNGERDEWDVLICVRCMGMTTIVNIRTAHYISEDNRGEDKNYDIRDDLGDCTKTEKPS